MASEADGAMPQETTGLALERPRHAAVVVAEPSEAHDVFEPITRFADIHEPPPRAVSVDTRVTVFALLVLRTRLALLQTPILLPAAFESIQQVSPGGRGADRAPHIPQLNGSPFFEEGKSQTLDSHWPLSTHGAFSGSVPSLAPHSGRTASQAASCAAFAHASSGLNVLRTPFSLVRSEQYVVSRSTQVGTSPCASRNGSSNFRAPSRSRMCGCCPHPIRPRASRCGRWPPPNRPLRVLRGRKHCAALATS